MNIHIPLLKVPGRLKFIPQMEVTECGAACLTMILAYYGCNIRLSEVREICRVSRDGTNAFAIVNAARQYGLVSKGLKLEISDLRTISLPVILHWDFNHFIILEKVSKKSLTIIDPASGRRLCNITDVGKHFTGAVLQFTPGADFKKRSKQPESLNRYKAMVSEMVPALIQVIIASICLQFIGLVFPVANQLLMDRVILPSHNAWLVGIAVGMGGAILIKALLNLSRGYVIQSIRAVFDFKLMSSFLDHMLHLPLSFFEVRETGDLVQRVQSNIALRDLLGTQLISVILDSMLLTAYAILMIIYSPLLGLSVICMALMRVGIFLKFREQNQQVMTAELAAAGRESGALLETISSIETTKASGAEFRMVQRFGNRMILRVKNSIKRENIALTINQLMIAIDGFTFAAVFIIGGYEVIKYKMTIGVFISFLMLKELFIAPLGTFFSTLGQLQFAGNHLMRLNDVFETPVEKSGSVDPGQLKGKICFQNVSFNYSPGAEKILKNISLSILPGQKVALVGPSGAGKSTLARLLLGMYQIESGTICFDDVNIRTIDLQKLRKQTGVVLQETFLFDDTIWSNLSLNDDSISIAQLKWAAQMAAIDEVIDRLPHGYDSRVGENGSWLSGGERQRLNIARALVHKPAILLFDEATSSLDLQTEKIIQKNLTKINCTQILIAHRLESIKDADLIVVMNMGEIVQTGTFNDLKAMEGLFATLLKSCFFKEDPEIVYE